MKLEKYYTLASFFSFGRCFRAATLWFGVLWKFMVLLFLGLLAGLKRRTPNQHDSRLGVLRLVKISFSGVMLPPSCLVDKGFDTLALDVGRIVAFVKVD